jgi:hypothetical protein
MPWFVTYCHSIDRFSFVIADVPHQPHFSFVFAWYRFRIGIYCALRSFLTLVLVYIIAGFAHLRLYSNISQILDFTMFK